MFSNEIAKFTDRSLLHNLGVIYFLIFFPLSKNHTNTRIDGYHCHLLQKATGINKNKIQMSKEATITRTQNIIEKAIIH